MSLFHPEYTERVNVPIFTGVTALTLYSVEVVILEFGQGLWFGNRIEKSLINPKQCQKFGIQIYDNPTDPYRKLKDELVELSRTLVLAARYINLKIFSCQMNLIWIHQRICMKFHQWRRIIGQVQFFHQYINIVERRVSCAPPTIQCRDDSGIHEFDRAMEKISIRLAQYLMVGRLLVCWWMPVG